MAIELKSSEMEEIRKKVEKAYENIENVRLTLMDTYFEGYISREDYYINRDKLLDAERLILDIWNKLIELKRESE